MFTLNKFCISFNNYLVFYFFILTWQILIFITLISFLHLFTEADVKIGEIPKELSTSTSNFMTQSPKFGTRLFISSG